MSSIGSVVSANKKLHYNIYNKNTSKFEKMEKGHAAYSTAERIDHVFFLVMLAFTIVGLPIAIIWAVYDILKKEPKELSADDFTLDVEEEDVKGPEDDPIGRAITSLQNDKKLGNNTINQYFMALKTAHPDTFEYVDDLLFGRELDFSKIDGCDKPYVFVPLILTGAVIDHIVLLTFDTKTKELYYYNSQGGTFEMESRNIKGSNRSLKKLFKNSNFKGAIISNQNKQQTDHETCGFFVIKFVNEWLKKSTESANTRFTQITAQSHKQFWSQEKETLNQLRQDAIKILESSKNPL